MVELVVVAFAVVALVAAELLVVELAVVALAVDVAAVEVDFPAILATVVPAAAAAAAICSITAARLGAELLLSEVVGAVEVVAPEVAALAVAALVTAAVLVVALPVDAEAVEVDFPAMLATVVPASAAAAAICCITALKLGAEPSPSEVVFDVAAVCEVVDGFWANPGRSVELGKFSRLVIINILSCVDSAGAASQEQPPYLRRAKGFVETIGFTPSSLPYSRRRRQLLDAAPNFERSPCSHTHAGKRHTNWKPDLR